MTEYQQQLYQDYPELFETAEKVELRIKLLLEEFNGRNLKLFDLPANQRIFLFIMTRSFKTYSSILELCRNGYGQDVATLLRSLLENLVTARYIIHDKKTANTKAARFVAYKWIIFKRHLPDQERNVRHASDADKNDFLDKKHRILEKVEEFKNKFGITSDRALVTWSGKTIRDMAKEVDISLLNEYETTFRLCSRFSHPTILGDNEYLIQDDQKLIFSPLPSNIGVVQNLSNAIKYTINFLYIVNDLFLFNQKNIIEQIENDFKSISVLEKYQDLPKNTNKLQKNTASIKLSTISFKTHQ